MFYDFEDCTGCPLKDRYQSQRKQITACSQSIYSLPRNCVKNILIETDTLYSVNCSIQVEETFGVLKESYHLKKFRTRGTGNVRNEFLILAFSYNFNKIHTKIQTDRLNLYYHPLIKKDSLKI
ncbi:transposase [Oceanobacillus jeddahense]|uniref:transposase n=1 Tax=Oceanobacillus jeddahense TaxID=1462527 RepID=UPI0009DEF4B6